MIRKSKRGEKTVYLDGVGVWWNKEHNRIHVTVKDVKGFHTTVNCNENSKRGHLNLFYKLARCLRDAGAPHPPIPDEERSTHDT